jgi:hypothetical protein
MLRVVLWIGGTVAVLFVGFVFWTNYAATVANVLFEGKEPKKLPEANYYWERVDARVSTWERDKLRRDLSAVQADKLSLDAREKLTDEARAIGESSLRDALNFPDEFEFHADTELYDKFAQVSGTVDYRKATQSIHGQEFEVWIYRDGKNMRLEELSVGGSVFKPKVVSP